MRAEDSVVDGDPELERLRAILRRCQRGPDVIEIAPGEFVGLHLRPEEPG